MRAIDLFRELGIVETREEMDRLVSRRLLMHDRFVVHDTEEDIPLEFRGPVLISVGTKRKFVVELVNNDLSVRWFQGSARA